MQRCKEAGRRMFYFGGRTGGERLGGNIEETRLTTAFK